jgi:hypothetical protein
MPSKARAWALHDSAGLCRSIYTELMDVETECNRLLTYDRKVGKADLKVVAEPMPVGWCRCNWCR